MKKSAITTTLVTASLLIGVPPSCVALAADGRNPATEMDAAFSRADANQDGAISLEELIAAGKDDLAFRAMDINGDDRLTADEYPRRRGDEALPQGN